jgi:hypothetical protein
MMRGFRERLRERFDPKSLFYEGQKIRTRLVRLLEAVERLSGARPGPKLQVHFKGTENLETQVRRAGRRVSLALVAGGAFVGASVASLGEAPAWTAPTMGIFGGGLSLALIFDLLRGRRP